jgi:acetyl-CoA acyltransferase
MNAYIVTLKRSAVGKAPKGSLRFKRPDDLAAETIRGMLDRDMPEFDHNKIDDVIVGNATPEAEQGLNVGRMISLMSLDTEKVPGMTVNRYCASGLETIAIAASKIDAGISDCIIAGGVESMSPIPFGGWRIVPNPKVAKKNPTWYWNMGLTAEAVAEDFKVSREDQDEFGYNSHMKAINAIDEGRFKDEVIPIEVEETYLDANEKQQTRSYTFETEEGPRRDSDKDKMAKLKPVFKQGGSVTAGNASQTSDGAAFAVVMSEKMVKELNLEPVARLVSYTAQALEPRIMGMGPAYAVPRVLDMAGMKQKDIELYELNEAFASQSLAVMRELDLPDEQVNVNGGAIAMGHPLGCTGAKLSVQLIHEMRRREQKYGIVTMCVGTGQGGAGIFERQK